MSSSSSLFFSLLVCIFVQQAFAALRVTQINKGDLYAYTDSSYLGMFMVTPKGVIAFDAPRSSNQNGNSILDTIKQYTNQPVKWVIYSHHHTDHIGGAVVFPKDAKYICHKNAAKLIQDSGLPPCTKKVNNDPYTLKVDETHLVELEYHGTIHTEDNLYIYVPYYKLLMLADFVFPQWGPGENLGMQATIVKYLEAFDIVLGYDFDHYVGGHVDRVGNRTDVTVQRQLINDLMGAVQKAMSEVQFSDSVVWAGGMTGTNAFTISAHYTNAITEHCYNTMVTGMGWDKKLIDVTAFMETYCGMIYKYLTINY